ncbi:MAG TPA: glycoside hydrolase family 2 TIM barrel-domain containing protein [Candidatus Sulfotelmatobacter sp.]|nr:glycoside hydrolase family 2 TIM barrel-domain containing protein [Candidatus Sulfotelmatobacter sp.]
MPARAFLTTTFLTLVLLAASSAQQVPEGNIALSARATASSEAEGTKAEFVNDGNITNTQWSAKEGTSPQDTWIELNWLNAIEFQEIVIRQEGSPKLSHVDIATRDADGNWHPLKSAGDSVHLLTRLILAQFPVVKTTGLRLTGFTGRVSLAEIEVYNRFDPPVVVMGSDLLNHIFGVVTDAFGTQPFANASVQVEGTAGGKHWQATSQTDDNGMFQVDMPVGMDGEVTAVANLAGASAHQTLQAGDLSPGLSLPDTSTASIDLDGIWRFKPDPGPDFFKPDFPDADWKEIKVPSHWMMEGFDSNTGTGAYRRHLQIPPSFRGRRIKLLFDGVYSGAEVWMNGKRVGSHEGGFSPFELDITDSSHVGGDNLLAVLVREKTISSHLDNMSFYANFPLTGIFRPVHLMSLPELHVRRFHVSTVFDSSYTNGTLTLELSIENESGHDVSGVPLIFTLKDPQGRTVSLQNDRLDVTLSPWSRLERRIDFQISSPQHWEAEHPLLYTLSAKYSENGASEMVSRRFGFRQIEIRGSEFLINGVPVKMHGANHYEMDPLNGRSVTPDLTRKDLLMMKEDNLDAIRTSTFPAVQDLYDDSDELGFYIEEEGPFCWVDESSDLRFLPTFVQRTAEMLERDRSHPSVVYWSVGNESTWGPDFEAAHQFVKRHDPTRPASAGQSATLELDTMHNPISLARMKERENVKVPIMWDESMAPFQGNLWGDTREVWLDPGERDYYIQPLIPVWDAVQSSKNVQASIIWAWVDDAFLVPGRDSEYGRGSIGRPLHFLDHIYHMPGRGIVGDAPWGIVDGWRRKKPEFWHVKMLFSPVHMQDRDLPNWKPGDPVTFTVNNRYEFTNLSELTLNWSVGDQHGTLHPNIAPHTSGQVSIPVGAGTRAGDVLSLQFLDSKGGLVMPHRMRLGVAPRVPQAPSAAGPLRYVHEPSWLGGPMERLLGDNFEIAFDGANGRIRRALIDRHSVLYDTPKLHVQPIEATLEEFPIFETWRLGKPLDIHPLGNDYEVVEIGTYRDFAGELRFRISPEGSIRVSYDFIYTGTDVRAREVGLQFGMPGWCDKLQWKRHGEWTVYPDDHIGRNEGTAMAHAPGPQSVPPKQSYAEDDTPLGTNDFRSTKRDFVFASLTDKDGYGLGIEAIGTQHLRAMVDSDEIQVNVNDWFGGVAATAWGEWWQNYGTGRELRSDDPNEGVSRNRVSGGMQLYLLSPKNSAAWISREEARSAPEVAQKSSAAY